MNTPNTQARAGAIRRLLLVTVTAAGLGWSGLFPTDAAQKPTPQTYTILIKNFEFQPATLTVKPGDTVIWKNEDIVPHTATANNKRFDSKSIESKASWKFVAGKAGTYPYICTFHPTMKAQLIVKQ